MEHEMIGLIGIFVVQVFGLLGGRIAYNRQKNDYKKIIKEQKEDNDSFKNDMVLHQKDVRKELSKMNTKILKIENQIESLLEVHKHRDFEHQLIRNLNDQVVMMTQDHSRERLILKSALEKIIPVIRDILDTDFSIVKTDNIYEKMRLSIYPALLDENSGLLNSVLKGSDRDIFKTKIQTEIKVFSSALALLAADMTNGERRKGFEDTTQEFMKNIIIKTISL